MDRSKANKRVASILTDTKRIGKKNIGQTIRSFVHPWSCIYRESTSSETLEQVGSNANIASTMASQGVSGGGKGSEQKQQSSSSSSTSGAKKVENLEQANAEIERLRKHNEKLGGELQGKMNEVKFLRLLAMATHNDTHTHTHNGQNTHPQLSSHPFQRYPFIPSFYIVHVKA